MRDDDCPLAVLSAINVGQDNGATTSSAKSPPGHRLGSLPAASGSAGAPRSGNEALSSGPWGPEVWSEALPPRQASAMAALGPGSPTLRKASALLPLSEQLRAPHSEAAVRRQSDFQMHMESRRSTKAQDDLLKGTSGRSLSNSFGSLRDCGLGPAGLSPKTLEL